MELFIVNKQDKLCNNKYKLLLKLKIINIDIFKK